MTAEILAHWNDFDNETQVRVETEEGKATRIVSFVRDGDDIKISYWEEETLKPCAANRFGLHCGHCERTIQILLESLRQEPGNNLGSGAEQSGHKPLGLKP